MVFSTRLRTGLATLSALLLAAPGASAFDVELQPTSVEMEAEPGNRERQIVTIANGDDENTISLTLGLADWTLDRTGKIRLSPPGESEDSAADWARFSPPFVTLEPGESRRIIVDIIAPGRLQRTGDYRFALLASTILPQSLGGQAGVMQKYQVASLFYLTAGPASSEPVIHDARLAMSPDGSPAVELMLQNTGNAHARLEGSIRIEGDGESVNVPISNLVVLHASERRFRARVDAPLPVNPRVSVSFENTFAPQAQGRSMPVKTFNAPLNIPDAALAPSSGQSPASGAEH